MRSEHERIERGSLDRLRDIADALDAADSDRGTALIGEADQIVREAIVRHEMADEHEIFPGLRGQSAALSAMSRAHREILHLARLLGKLAAEAGAGGADAYLLRDAQRVIEAIEALVRMHNAQEEDIYEGDGGG